MISITIVLAAIVAACVVYLMRQQAKVWDSGPVVAAAKREERLNAKGIANVLIANFDALDVEGVGMITYASLEAIEGLDAPERDKTLIRYAITNAGGEKEVFLNPWLFGGAVEYQHEPIGHLIGKRMDEFASVGPYSASVVVSKFEVDDFGIDMFDLESYVDRVETRNTN